MRDSRRRRMMLRDEVEGETTQPRSGESAAADAHDPVQPAYTSGARIENQPRMIDFVPTRIFLVLGIFLLLVAVVAFLNVAHFRILPFANAQGIAAGALQLSLDQGLLSWVASFLLLASAFFCFQVFQVRRFRADDFSGSYRVWIWLAFGFVLASVDATARVSPVMASLIAAQWESGFLSRDRNVWLLLVGMPATLAGLRLVIEIWRSRVALGSIMIAGTAYAAANLVRLDLLPVSTEDHAVVEANSVLVAHGLMFFTIVLYARFVLLESQGGNLAVVVARKKAARQSNAAAKASVSSSKESSKRGATESDPPAKASRNQGPAPSGAAASRDEDSVPDQATEEAEATDAESPTLKLMGQSVQSKKSQRKRKSSAQNRKRAA